MCDARDIGLSVNTGDDQPADSEGWSRRSSEGVGGAKADTPRIFLYDAYPGGIGFSAPLWGMQQELLSRTRVLIMGCDCDTGCPVCVGPIGETGPLAKTVALRLLDHLIGTALPEGDGVGHRQIEDVPF